MNDSTHILNILNGQTRREALACYYFFLRGRGGGGGGRGELGKRQFIFRELRSTSNYFQAACAQDLNFVAVGTTVRK